MEKHGWSVENYYCQIYQARASGVKQQRYYLQKGGFLGTIVQICQNELTNHIRVIALARMGFVHGLPPRQDVPLLSADALKAALN